MISACPDLRLHTVVSGRPEDVHAAYPDARVVAELEPALADPGIALVVIATPNALHAPQAEAALKAGKSVVIDKPFAVTLDEARRLAALAETESRLLSVFHNRRWDADFLTLKAEIEAGSLGPIVTLESRFDRYRPRVRDRWRERDQPGGGLWHDLGPHLIDQALVLFGRPLGVACDLAVLRQGGQAVDYAHCILRYADRRVVLHADMVSPAHDLRFRVQGRDAAWLKRGLDAQEDRLKAGATPGGDDWGRDSSPGVRIDGDGARTPTPGSPGDYPAYYAAIARALRGEGPNPVPPKEALAVMEVLEAAIESAGRRAEIQLSGSGSASDRQA